MPVDVDVIILSWDRVTETLAAIDSAAAQTGVEKRIWVVDQGSKPENLAILRDAIADRPEIHLKELGRNVGVALGRNIASALGEAPYIVALDNDAVFKDRVTLASVVGRMNREPRLGAIAFRILNYFTGRDDAMCWDYPGVSRGMADREFLTTRFIGAGHALRRAAFEGVGGYDETLFFAGEERDVSYRILNLGYAVRYCPDYAVLHKVDPTARVNWQSGRFYYSVRNVLYSDFKFGMPWWRLARSAAALTLKGMSNRVVGQALRGIWDATRMSRRFVANGRPEIYRLNSVVRDYIRSYEHQGETPFMARLRRQFERLPEQV